MVDIPYDYAYHARMPFAAMAMGIDDYGLHGMYGLHGYQTFMGMIITAFLVIMRPADHVYDHFALS